MYLQGDIKLLLVTVNNRLKFAIEIVHDLSCHPIYQMFDRRPRTRKIHSDISPTPPLNFTRRGAWDFAFIFDTRRIGQAVVSKESKTSTILNG